MKLIIDIDKNFYEMVKRKVADGMHQSDRCWEIIAKGVPESEKGTDLISRKKALEMVEKNKQQIAIYRAIEALPSGRRINNDKRRSNKDIK